jgi:hypothetical protein
MTKTRTVDNLFNFKESEKSLTMDSLPFSRFSLLSPKKVKVIEENSPSEMNLPRCTFFLFNLEVEKRGKLMPIDFFLKQLMSVKEQGHSMIFSILRSLKKSLTMDFVEDILLDHFNV